EEIEQVLIDDWRQIGVALEVSNIPSSVLFGSWSANAPRKKGNFDVNMYASSPDIDPQETVPHRFGCHNIPRPENNGAGFNYYRYCDPQTDQLIKQAGSIVDQDKRKQLYSTILKRLNDAQISVWLYNRSNIDAYRSNVGGYKDDGWDNLTWNTQDWFVNNKKPRRTTQRRSDARRCTPLRHVPLPRRGALVLARAPGTKPWPRVTTSPGARPGRLSADRGASAAVRSAPPGARSESEARASRTPPAARARPTPP